MCNIDKMDKSTLKVVTSAIFAIILIVITQSVSTVAT